MYYLLTYLSYFRTLPSEGYCRKRLREDPGHSPPPPPPLAGRGQQESAGVTGKLSVCVYLSPG